MDKTWTVKTDGGPIKYVSVSGQEFDLSRVRGRWRLRDYLNRLEADAKLAREMRESLTVGPDDLIGAIQPNAWYNDWCAHYDAAHSTPEVQK